MSGWQECKLGDVAKVQTGPFGSQLHQSDYKAVGTPIITVEHLGDNRIVHSVIPLVSDLDKERLIKYTLKEGDVVFSRVGSVDRCAYVHKEEDGWMFSGRLLRVRAQDNFVNSRFLSFYFSQESFKDTIRMIAVGATMPSINTEILSNVEILLPPIPEQRAIAGVLSSLDDKIDLLYRQNKTLEAMAETLFRQWFVEAVDEGWEEKPLSSIANFLNGLACQKYPPKNNFEKLPVLKIKELGSGISDSSDWATTHVSPEYIVQAGDVIFAWSASLMVKVWDGEKCVLNQHLFKVTSDQYPKWFYLAWCKHHLAEFISISLSHATTMGHIKRGDLDAAIVLVPSDTKLSAISKQMTPLLDRQIVNAKQIRTLQKLRDTLLPKLMSGEVRVDV